MAPSHSPVADVWRSPGLLGRIALFLGPSHTAWALVRVNRAAAAAFYSDGKRLPRTISLRNAFQSGLLAIPKLRLQARAMCRSLTRQQRLEALCLAAASDCSREGLEGAVVVAGLLPPPLAVGWSEEQEAQAASGDLVAVRNVLYGWQLEGQALPWRPWWSALISAQTQRVLARQTGDAWSFIGQAYLSVRAEFYCGAHAGLAVARLTRMHPAALNPTALLMAADAGHVEAVRFLLSRGVRPDRPLAASVAARRGHVGVLQALHEAGCDLGDPADHVNAAMGSWHVFEWLLETFGAAALRVCGFAFILAASAGSVAVLKALPPLLDAAALWWRVSSNLWVRAAASGSEEAVELLAEKDAPAELYCGAIRDAASQGDLHMVQCLCKLGSPLGAQGAEALAQAASRVPASASALPWLEEPLGPPKWQAAATLARAEARAEVALCCVESALSTICMALAAGLWLVDLVVQLCSVAVHPYIVPVLECARGYELLAFLLLLAIWALVWVAPPRHRYEPNLAQHVGAFSVVVLAIIACKVGPAPEEVGAGGHVMGTEGLGGVLLRGGIAVCIWARQCVPVIPLGRGAAFA
ncbi:hypothetical protein HYH03_001166 [Edaphochlamys debaryana]|uniref:Uncharacterized protein n=1 Tax=Edaphochlamys debaryana TaxID=47281 RepID=A0A835YET9_9CHLO|nr:hypothetical protein HYH03_001166 [Edaphochlamys debaryana]|eukprot:KAG2501378.1 hypothetical protein HYH03_001166 [Edaphochlamys debaryana]